MNRKVSVAPMMDYTDRHERYFLRLISKNVLLYTEMIVSEAIDKGDKKKLLNLIENLNSHWKRYDNLIGKVSDIKILTLLSLELQDSLFDLKNKNKINAENNLKSNSDNYELKKTLNFILENIIYDKLPKSWYL